MKLIAYAAWGLFLASFVVLVIVSPGTLHSVMFFVLAATAVVAAAVSMATVVRQRSNTTLTVIAGFAAALGALGILVSLFLLSQDGAQEGDIGGSGLFVLAVVVVLLAVPLANLPRRGVRS